MTETPEILILDEDEPFVQLLTECLLDCGYRVFAAPEIQTGIRIITEKRVPVVLLGMNQSKERALEHLRSLKSRFPYIEVIVFARRGNFRAAFSAMSMNAFDLLLKSNEVEEFVPIIDQAYWKARENLKGKFSSLGVPGDGHRVGTKMIGKSAQTQRTLKLIHKVAPADSSVLLTGETGVGKELAARLIHENSQRKDGPFVPLNCGAIPEALLENELFGHAKGAFTDSVQLKRGLLEEANRGTLFLDEVSELSPVLQVKLLRVLEDGTFRRLGDNKEIMVDFRVISASNRNLAEEMKSGRFRHDLFYRLGVVPIQIQPLRNRREDISLLVEYFLKRFSQTRNSAVKKISLTAMQILEKQEWPGNVRQLRNVIERLTILSDSRMIGISDVTESLQGTYDLEPGTQGENGENTAESSNLLLSLEELQRSHIQRVMDAVGGSLRSASEILGIAPQDLAGRIDKETAS